MYNISWYTQDTQRRIIVGEHRTVYMSSGTQTFREDCYQGNGEFGGMNYFKLLAEMNGKLSEEEGRQLYDSNSLSVLYPSLTESGTFYGGRQPQEDPFRGEPIIKDLEDYDDSEYSSYDDDGDYNW